MECHIIYTYGHVYFFFPKLYTCIYSYLVSLAKISSIILKNKQRKKQTNRYPFLVYKSRGKCCFSQLSIISVIGFHGCSLIVWCNFLPTNFLLSVLSLKMLDSVKWFFFFYHSHWDNCCCLVAKLCLLLIAYDNLHWLLF